MFSFLKQPLLCLTQNKTNGHYLMAPYSNQNLKGIKTQFYFPSSNAQTFGNKNCSIAEVEVQIHHGKAHKIKCHQQSKF